MLVALCAALAVALAVPSVSGEVREGGGAAQVQARQVKRSKAPARSSRAKKPSSTSRKSAATLRKRAPALALPKRPAAARAGAASRPKAKTARRPAVARGPSPALRRALAGLAAVKRDPARRARRVHWERSIAAIERAATGPDRASGLLEAARARYALYRYSQVESDRDTALRLAWSAGRAGEREAAAFARAVRREKGDEAPPRDAAASTGTPRSAAARATDDEEEGGLPNDPELRRALSDSASPASGEGQVASGPSRVTGVRSWSSGDYQRIVFYLSSPASFTESELAASGGAPRRLALRVASAVLDRAMRKPSARVAGVMAEELGGREVRLSVVLRPDAKTAVFALDEPPRLVVDVGERPGEPGETTPSRESSAPGRRSSEEALARARPIRRIVVDAGHGGHDTGAIGPSHLREKDVTLALARRLRGALRARRYEVVMTRKDDTYVPLEERAAIANAHRGDLFISLHANAHPHRDRKGVETWVLEVADGRYAKRLAARENGAYGEAAVLRASSAAASGDVRRILTDLDAQASAASSRRLAELVQKQVCDGIGARVGEVRDLGVKSALFYVLLGARMPAILVESSFISNRVEERRLGSSRFQQVVADSIARAVETYARREERLAAR